MELMGKDTVLTALREMTGWEYRDNSITKTFEPGSFRQAAGLFNRIVDAAEQQNHHPDVHITGGGELTITLTTHSEGGVTGEDVKLATTIEKLSNRG